MHRISAIAAIGKNTRVLGKDNDLVFKIPEDLKRFRTLTTLTKGHPVIMGRKTWESLPEVARPLPNRANFVVTRQASYAAEGATVSPTIEAAIEGAKNAEGSEEIFIIGGGELYTLALPFVNRLYLTLVDADAEGDAYFPEYPEFTKVVEHESHPEHTPPFDYVTLERP